MDNNGLVLCSVMAQPVRQRILKSILTWLDIISVVPNHTFVVEEAAIPLDRTEPSGYWYCAGDFCDIDEAGVHQHLEDANISLAKCLVSPDIKDDHELRPVLVIAGEYSVNYVCHNIANRVLYATPNHLTLGDIEIPKNGYSAVIKSTLGVYGQNKVEWKRRHKNCSQSLIDEYTPDKPGGSGPDLDEQRREIDKIHIAACHGDEQKAHNLTNALYKVDYEFLKRTEQTVQKYEEGLVNFEEYTQLMVNACSILFNETIKIVGRKLAQEIYSGCNLDIQYTELEVEAPKYFAAGG